MPLGHRLFDRLDAPWQAAAQQWTRFRGPNGSGISPARNVPIRWSKDDYNWRAALPGVGYASPVLWGDKLFITSGDEPTATQHVLCLDAATGRRRWSREFAAAHHSKHKLNSFASGTPAVDEWHVYIAWANPKEFVVLALNHKGETIWRRDLGPFKASHGGGVSPIVHDDLVVVPNEQSGESSLVALDRASGAIRWQIARDSNVTYSTPCAYRRQGGSAELIFTNWKNGVTAVDPTTGQVNWKADIFDKSHIEMAIGSPVVAGDLLLVTCGWLGHGNEVIAVRPKYEAGKVAVEQVYRISRSAPLCTTPLVKGDLLFLWSDDGVVTCADAATGQVHWRRRAGVNYYDSPNCVGDRVYNVSAAGGVVVLAADRRFRRRGGAPLRQGRRPRPDAVVVERHVARRRAVRRPPPAGRVQARPR